MMAAGAVGAIIYAWCPRFALHCTDSWKLLGSHFRSANLGAFQYLN